jgi:hypothetical protein
VGRKTRSFLRAFLIATALATGANAQDPSRVAAATVLFDEAIKDMEAGRLDLACPKLARSQDLAPSGGTLLALGDCYQRSGKLTSAWLAFREAASRAAAAGKRDAEQGALDRARNLEHRLPRLTVNPPASPPAGLEVQRDGVVLAPSELGIATPIDPGKHEIRATAPGVKQPWVRVIDANEGLVTTVTIPASLDASPPPNPPPKNDVVITPPPEEGSWSTQKTLGLVLAGVGVATMAVGGVFGLMAKSDNDEALEPKNCRTREKCFQSGLDLTDTANTKANISTALFIVGGVFTVGGAFLFFTAPKPVKGASLQIAPVFTGRAGGAAAVIRW